MSREEYLAYKTQGQFPHTILYNFYLEQCKENCIDMDRFYSIVQIPHMTPQGPLMFNIQLAFERVMEHYDTLFQVNSIKDKNENVIKYY